MAEGSGEDLSRVLEKAAVTFKKQTEELKAKREECSATLTKVRQATTKKTHAAAGSILTAFSLRRMLRLWPLRLRQRLPRKQHDFGLKSWSKSCRCATFANIDCKCFASFAR